jgi:hypothetical protein
MLHSACTEKPKPVHVGFGDYATADEIQWVALYLLLEALLAVKSDVVAELFSTETDPVKWCWDHGFIRRGEVCAQTLHAARIAQGLKQQAPDGLPVWPVVPGVRSWPGRLPVLPCVIAPGWDPSTETLAAYKARFNAACNQHLEAMEAAAKRAGLVPTPIKLQPQHFCWAAMFQCVPMDVPSIAEEIGGEEGAEVRTIHRGITDVLNLIGLDRRRVTPGPKR